MFSSQQHRAVLSGGVRRQVAQQAAWWVLVCALGAGVPAGAADATAPADPAAAQEQAPAASGSAAATRPGPAPAQAVAPGRPGTAAYRYRPARFAGRAGQYYRHYWGIDQLTVREAESGQILRFTWRVVDPVRAGVLNDKKLEPTLIAPEVGVSLVVPTLDKIGQLRQTIAPEAGRSYWMAFSNKGHLIKRGDRVDVVVGTFRAEGLVVD